MKHFPKQLPGVESSAPVHSIGLNHEVRYLVGGQISDWQSKVSHTGLITEPHTGFKKLQAVRTKQALGLTSTPLALVHPTLFTTGVNKLWEREWNGTVPKLRWSILWIPPGFPSSFYQVAWESMIGRIDLLSAEHPSANISWLETPPLWQDSGSNSGVIMQYILQGNLPFWMCHWICSLKRV